jgi:tol-pal system protein YbgF
MSKPLFLSLLLLHAPAAFAQASAPAEQVTQIERRVGTLEGQMRAVQRQVFPGGDKRFFAPEVVPEPQAPTPAATASSTPLVELTQRVTALEMQQRQLTGQVEQLQFQLRQLEAALQKQRSDAEFRLDQLEGKGAPAKPPVQPPTGALPPGAADPARATPPAPKPAATKPPAPKAGATKPPAQSPAPSPPGAAATPPVDPTEAAFRAAYAQYTEKDYAGASKALQAFVAENPKHPRASNAQYWAGRALLAQGQAPQAAKAFLAGYQSYPRGDRAHNSLLWLGKALIQMKQPKAACQALDQLRTAYPEKLVGQFAAETSAARKNAACTP